MTDGITLTHAVICDIDGTLADNTHRNPYDYDLVHLDTPIEPIVKLAQILGEHFELLFVTGRPASCYSATSQWLIDTLGFAYPPQLFMRAIGDNRPDAVVKQEVFEDVISKSFTVDYVIEDRNRVVAMWRSLGLLVLHVTDFPF